MRRSAARPCGRARRHRPRPADRLRPRGGRRGHRPRAGRSWSGRARDRAPAPWSRRRRASSRPCSFSSRRSCTGRSRKAARPGPVGQGRAVELDPLAGVDLGLAIERQVIGVLGDHHVGDRAPRWAGRPRSAAPAPAPGPRRPRRRGRRTWAGAPPARGTGPGRCPAARRRPRRSGAGRPRSRGRSCPRYRRRSRSAADAPAAIRGWPARLAAARRFRSGCGRLGRGLAGRLACWTSSSASSSWSMRQASRRGGRSGDAAAP